MTKKHSRIVWLGTAFICVLFVVMPFHAFIVTVFGHYVGAKSLISVWKELVVVLISIFAFFYWFKNRSTFTFDTINILSFSIIGLSLLVSIVNTAINSAFLVGVKTNIFPILLFASAQIFSSQFSDKKLRYLVFVPAVIVTVLALLQPYLFHPNLLLKIGYGPEGANGTILAGQYIESAATTVRAFSTLGGPNQLGTYLLFPALVALAYALSEKKWKHLILAGLFSAGVYVSYSRSALIGLLFGIFVLIAIHLPRKFRLATFIGMGVALAGLFFLLLSPNQCNYIDNLPKPLIHGSCSNNVLSGSDQQRVESQRNGVQAIDKQLFGYGLGTAGPASFYSNKPLITENWYLQIAIEIGIFGLLLYLIFFSLLGREFYQKGIQNGIDSIWPSACLALLVAIGVASMFLHTPADSTLAIIGFTTFGIIRGRKL